jgi:hypothetical protein
MSSRWVGCLRYMSTYTKRTSHTDEVGCWDNKSKYGSRFTAFVRANETGGAFWIGQQLSTPKAGVRGRRRGCTRLNAGC